MIKQSQINERTNEGTSESTRGRPRLHERHGAEAVRRAGGDVRREVQRRRGRQRLKRLPLPGPSNLSHTHEHVLASYFEAIAETNA